MNGIGKKCWKALLFLTVGVLLFRVADHVLLDKTAYAKYRNYRDEKNVDILILGSSHSDNGINARQLEDIIQDDGGQRSLITVFTE